MKFVIYGFMICFIAFTACGKKEYDLTVMTFNVRYDNPADGFNRWEYRIPIITTYMDTTSADIIGMQEVLHNQIVDLQKMIPDYAYTGTGRDDGKQRGEYSPIFFRKDRFTLLDHSQFWLSETPDIPGSRSWDAAITRIVCWAKLEDKKSGEHIYVFNTHFDHRGVEARQKSIELMTIKINEITDNSPVIVTGDFNIRKGSEHYDFMVHNFSENNALTNAELISKAPVTDAESTFNGFRTEGVSGVIDFIFVNDDFVVNSYRVDNVIKNGVFISDHWPVISKIVYHK